MADYAEYLRSGGGIDKRRALANNASALTDDLIQMLKNRQAPVIGGSGASTSSGGGGSVGSYTPSSADFKNLGGGKVSPVNAGVSQGWGKSRIKYAAGRHTGIDFGAKTGTRVGAAAAGVVIRAGSEGAYGNAIHVRHKDGTTTLYAHLSGIGVKAGQKVKAGQQIGKVGNTGRSFGSHLHFEVRKADKYGGDINPKSWFSTR